MVGTSRGAKNVEAAFKKFSLDRNLAPPVEQRILTKWLCEKLKARKPNYIYDNLTRTPDHLLNTALSGILPNTLDQHLKSLPNVDKLHLPAGYHLIHFPPPTLPGILLPDGTDTLHSPGEPWVRRMWAGGSIEFSSNWRRSSLRYSSKQTTRLHCREQIRDVVEKGNPRNEKIFVHLERIIGPVNSSLAHDEVNKHAAIIEKRDLVFMPAKKAGEAVQDAARESRVIKPIIKPDFSVPMIPDANLLFRFSALTFNAHRIHLDRGYAREVEGYRNLVVHGPLSLVLMLKVLSSQIGPDHMVKNITYKNLAPLFADEQMTICIRRNPSQQASNSNNTDQVHKSLKMDDGNQKWDVWIEGRDGGYAVKGSAETGFPDPEDTTSASSDFPGELSGSLYNEETSSTPIETEDPQGKFLW